MVETNQKKNLWQMKWHETQISVFRKVLLERISAHLCATSTGCFPHNGGSQGLERGFMGQKA